MTETENTPAAVDELQAQIVTQLEFYFGNINLPKDKFLQEELKKDEGWVPVATFLNFNRLAKLTKDLDLIATSVKNGQSDIVSLSDDGTKIRRNPGNPLPENSLEYWQTIKHNTVYMKGFKENTTLDEIMTFAKKYGKVENVLMRRTKPDRIFKGSAFVTYKTHEEALGAQKSADKFGEGENAIELTKMMQDDYWTMKNNETKEKRAAEKLAKSGKKAVEQAEKLQAKAQVRFVKGLILQVEGFADDSDMRAIKDHFKTYGDVAYVVYEKGGTKAEIRFGGEENGAQVAWEKALKLGDGKVVYNEKELTGKVLDGEEEEKYWTAFNASKQNRNEKSSGRGGGRGRNRGGRGGFRGGRGGKRSGDRDHSDGPRGKRTVFADDDGQPAAEAE